MVELMGIAAGIIVACSFFMKNIVRLRAINCAGCLAFVLYGLLIGSISVWALNAFVFGLNIFRICQSKFMDNGKLGVSRRSPGAKRLIKY